jgi:hypothetical protein
MKITIEFNCDNDSFGPDECDRSEEIVRILENAAYKAAAMTTNPNADSAPILDRNGNSIGFVKVTK